MLPVRYNDMLDCMAAADIEPNATLHHFTHPQWFEELGGFEKEENIPLFVEWCVKAVELFGSRIHFWATFNEPTVRLVTCAFVVCRTVCAACGACSALAVLPSLKCLEFTTLWLSPSLMISALSLGLSLSCALYIMVGVMCWVRPGPRAVQ